MENVIIVPLYKNHLNRFERISLEQCFKVFNNKAIYAVKPESLNLEVIESEFSFTKVISFADSFFADIHGYNSLMLSEMFYKRFLNFNYMLIYQTDAFAFSDQLDLWANSGYDYIGAPWIKPLKNIFFVEKLIFNLKSYFYIKLNLKKNGLPKGKQFYNKVGNGGFSLRRISKFHEICISKKNHAQKYINLKNSAFNEDLFWSIEVNRRQKLLHIPNYKIAAKFSAENYPDHIVKLNKGILPFGCHAWEKNLKYWKKIFQIYGFEI